MSNHKIKFETIGLKPETSYLALPSVMYTRLKLKETFRSSLVFFNTALSDRLGLDFSQLSDQEISDIFSGNIEIPGTAALAQAYAGHQFGRFTYLGDGRALLLTEHMTPEGKRVDIQLKGSGPTPYSRGGDGLATLGPMLREYLISEAMAGLHIPTTRSLAVVKTNRKVRRETDLEGAILTRTASSHIRVGTFQFAISEGGKSVLKALADYTITRHFSHIKNDQPYLELLNEVIRRQAKLIAQWQLVGFVHGVMNTDNMSICGETIDYGPCAFMDVYDPKTVFSSIDYGGRYAYVNQPGIASWNLARFAETLLPILAEDPFYAQSLAQNAVETFLPLFKKEWLSGMRRKLGLFNEEVADESLIEELLSIMHKAKSDYTKTFVRLTTDISGLEADPDFSDWIVKYKLRRSRQIQNEEQSVELMKSVNPAMIPRNHLVEEALKQAVENQDMTYFERLIDLLREPYGYSEQQLLTDQPDAQSNRPYRTTCGT